MSAMSMNGVGTITPVISERIFYAFGTSTATVTYLCIAVKFEVLVRFECLSYKRREELGDLCYKYHEFSMALVLELNRGRLKRHV